MTVVFSKPLVLGAGVAALLSPFVLIVGVTVVRIIRARYFYDALDFPANPQTFLWSCTPGFEDDPPMAMLHPKGHETDHKRFGKMWKARLASVPFVFIHDRDFVPILSTLPKSDAFVVNQIIGNSLVLLQGDAWKKRRGALEHGFRPLALKALVAPFCRHAQRLVQQLTQLSAEGKPAEMDSLLTKTTLDIIIDTGFGFAFADNRALADALSNVLCALFSPLVGVPFGAKFLVWQNRKSFKVINDSIDLCLEKRRAEGVTEDQQQRDLLDLLVSAKDSDGNPLSLQAIKDEMLLFFIAGHDTTAVTLTWAMALLGSHKEVLDKLTAEVDAVFGGGEIVYEKLGDLAYMDMVIKETLRLHAVVPNFTRGVVEDIEFKGKKIPKGTTVSLPIYLTHYDPEVWPEPEKFVPERFSSENRAKHAPNSWMPFTVGPRICLGRHFFYLEAKVILSTILQKFTFELVGEVPPYTLSKGTLHPEQPINVTLTPRQ